MYLFYTMGTEGGLNKEARTEMSIKRNPSGPPESILFRRITVLFLEIANRSWQDASYFGAQWFPRGLRHTLILGLDFQPLSGKRARAPTPNRLVQI